MTLPSSPSDPIAGPAPGRHLVRGLWLVALVLAVYPRLAFLLADTPSLDEWHPLLAVKREGFLRLATTFGLADRSIPVALYLKSLAVTGGLSPLGLRLPFAVSGLAVVLGLPWLLRRRLGALGAPLLALWFAVSPLLVFFARTIRPYGLAAGAALLAVFVYRDWSRGGERRHFFAYAGLVAGIGWALPVHLPFCLAPPAVDLAAGLARRDRGAARRALLAGCGALAAVLVLLAPALLADGEALAARAGVARVSVGGALAAVRILAGTWSSAAAWLVAGSVLASGVLLRRSAWVRDLAWASGLQAAAVVASGSLGTDLGVVLARYLLPAGLAGWTLLAAAADRLAARSSGARGTAAAGSLVLAAALWWSGPLHGWLGPGPDNFASTRLQARLGGAPPSPTAPLSAAYQRVAAGGPSTAAVLEVPFLDFVPEALPELQRRHRQVVYVGVTEGVCSRRHTFELPPDGRSGFALGRFVALDDLPALRARGIRYVVFHRNEEVAIPGLPPRQNFYDFDRCVGAFRKISGAATFDDGYVALFDLGPG